VCVIVAGVGGITVSDANLARASNAVLHGFDICCYSWSFTHS